MPKFRARIIKTIELEQHIVFEAEDEVAADTMLDNLTDQLNVGQRSSLINPGIWEEFDTSYGAEDLQEMK